MIAHAKDLFDVVTRKVVRVEIDQSFPLEQAASAHKYLEERRTRGDTILVP